MRRRQKRLPNFAQAGLPFAAAAASAATPPHGAEARFIDDSPRDLHLGVQPLAEYLRHHGLGWVVRLRQELERLDYSSLLIAYQGSGRPPFHPRTLLGLIIYGVLLRQWSLRDLEQLAVRDVGAWWMCGGHQPDHSTLGQFIVRHGAVLSEEFFTTLVRTLVRRLHLAPGVVAGDGTVVEAVASHLHTLKREAVQAAAERAQHAAATQPERPELAMQAAHAQAVLAVVEQRAAQRRLQGKDAAQTQIAPSEPAAVIQPRKDGAVRAAYKPSAWVHEAGIIVGQAVHASSETIVLPRLRQQHLAVFGAPPPTLLLDAAYCTPAVLQPLVADQVDVLCPSGRARGDGDWLKRSAPGRFSKADFMYDAEQNAYRCPAGQVLEQIEQSRDTAGRRYQRYRARHCHTCVLRARCTTDRNGRTLKRYDGEEYREAMAWVLSQPGARRRYRRRAEIAERPWAQLRSRQGLTRFHRRGTDGAAVEFALHCIAFNLKWMLTYPTGRTAVGFLIVLWARTNRWWSPVAIRGWCWL